MSHTRHTTFVPSEKYKNEKSNASDHVSNVASDVDDLITNNTDTSLYKTVADGINLDSSVRDGVADGDLGSLHDAVHNQLDVGSEHAVVVFDSTHDYGRQADGQGMFPLQAIQDHDGLPAVAIVFGDDSKKLVAHEMLHCYDCYHFNKVKIKNNLWTDPATVMHGNHGNSDCNNDSPSFGGWSMQFEISARDDCEDKDSTEKSVEIYDGLIEKWRDNYS